MVFSNGYAWATSSGDWNRQLSTPCIFYSFKGFSDPEIIATRQKGNLFLRFFFIYKRLNQSLG